MIAERRGPWAYVCNSLSLLDFSLTSGSHNLKLDFLALVEAFLKDSAYSESTLMVLRDLVNHLCRLQLQYFLLLSVILSWLQCFVAFYMKYSPLRRATVFFSSTTTVLRFQCCCHIVQYRTCIKV